MTGKYINVSIDNDDCVVNLIGQHEICYDYMGEVKWDNEELEIAAIIQMMGLNVGQTWRYKESGRTYFTYFNTEMNKLGMLCIGAEKKASDILLNGFEWDKLELIEWFNPDLCNEVISNLNIEIERLKKECKKLIIENQRLTKSNENLLLTNNNLVIEINRIKNSEALLIEELENYKELFELSEKENKDLIDNVKLLEKGHEKMNKDKFCSVCGLVTEMLNSCDCGMTYCFGCVNDADFKENGDNTTCKKCRDKNLNEKLEKENQELKEIISLHTKTIDKEIYKLQQKNIKLMTENERLKEINKLKTQHELYISRMSGEDSNLMICRNVHELEMKTDLIEQLKTQLNEAMKEVERLTVDKHEKDILYKKVTELELQISTIRYVVGEK